jgi:hypothetical protein
MKDYNKLWRIFFAVSLAGIAVLQLACGIFKEVIMPPWPAFITNEIIFIWIVSLLLFLATAAIIINKMARTIAFYMGWFFLVMFVAFHLPYQIKTNLHFLGAWTNPLKLFAYSGGAFIVAASLPKKSGSSVNAECFVPMGRIFFGIMLVVFGIEHFVYPAFVALLVPAWIPGQLFWTYFAGVALIGGGTGIALNIQLRIIANLVGIMLFLWLIMLHIPRAIADPYTDHGNEITSVFEALGFSGIAFLIAATVKPKRA